MKTFHCTAFCVVLMILISMLMIQTEASSEGKAYKIQGDYYDTCACAVSCPCGANASLPTEGHCDGVIVVHIKQGNVGDINMDGLNFAIVLRTPKGEKTGDAFFTKHELDLLTIYFDNNASPEQRAAMPQLMAGLLGTQPMKGFRPPQFATMKLLLNGDLAKFDIDDGSKLSFEIENINLDKINPSGPRPDSGNRITLTNVAPFAWIKDVTQGHSMFFRYNDFDTKWEYSNRNAFFGRVLASGQVPLAESKP